MYSLKYLQKMNFISGLFSQKRIFFLFESRNLLMTPKKFSFTLILLLMAAFAYNDLFAQTASQTINASYSGTVNNSDVNTEGDMTINKNSKRGFVVFDVSSLPSNATIISAVIICNSNSLGNVPDTGNFVYDLNVIPTSDTFITFNDANGGVLYGSGITWNYQRTSMNLNARAISEIQSNIHPGGRFAAALKPSSTVTQEWNFNTYANSVATPTLVINYSASNSLTPQSDFDAVKKDVVINEAVQFQDKSTNTPTTWKWDFNYDLQPGTNTSTTQNPSFAYSAPGKYTVTLMVTNSAGSDTKIKPHFVHVFATPTANFTASSDTSNKNLVYFKDASLNEATSWLWDFGDSTSSTEQNPIHNYATIKTYHVCLTASNIAGTSDTCMDVDLNNTSGFYNRTKNNTDFFSAIPTVFQKGINLECKDDKINSTPYEFVLFSIDGRKVYEETLSVKNTFINLESLKQGVYFISLSNGSVKGSKIIVKQD